MTNPNPVAPKTDTPARQGCIQLKPMSDVDAAAKLREIFSDLQTDFHDRWDWMEAEFSLLVLESTLAAERASRLQADTEQFNAGWINCRDYSAGQLREVASRLEQAYPDHSPQADTAYTIHKCADAIALSKPSVSPEQAEEKQK